MYMLELMVGQNVCRLVYGYDKGEERVVESTLLLPTKTIKKIGVEETVQVMIRIHFLS